MFEGAMILVRQAGEGLTELELSGEVNVFSAAQLHEEAMRLADQGCEVLVAAEQLTGLDAAIVQVLLALKMALGRQGRRLQFRGVTEELGETLRIAGLESCLSSAKALLHTAS